jgi:hypothetical protein
MRILTKIEYIDVDRNPYEMVALAKNSGEHFVKSDNSEFVDVEIFREKIQGVHFVSTFHGLDFWMAATENVDKILKTVFSCCKQAENGVGALNKKISDLENEIATYKKAKFLKRLKYLFGIK